MKTLEELQTLMEEVNSISQTQYSPSLKLAMKRTSQELTLLELIHPNKNNGFSMNYNALFPIPTIGLDITATILHPKLLKDPDLLNDKWFMIKKLGAVQKDLYCRYAPSKKRNVNYFPGRQPFQAISFDTHSGDWNANIEENFYRFIYQAEYCSFNAHNFFRNSFAENSKSDARICVPNPTSDWSSSDNQFDGNHGYFSENSFYAGAGVLFENIENNAKKLLYFDCACQTDPIYDLSCLGSDAFPGCVLYTNNLDYYNNYLYGDRNLYGLGFDVDRYYEYNYWKNLYNLNE